MRRVITLVAAVIVATVFLVPVAIAAEPFEQTGRVLMAAQADVTVPAGEQADLVVVVDGVATIEGTVNTLITVDGSAILTGADVESIVAVGSEVRLEAGSVVAGDVMTVDATVVLSDDAAVLGETWNLRASLVAFGAPLAPAFFLFWIGMGLSAIVAGLLLAGLASRQVRMAEGVIRREPVRTLAAGILGLVVFPILAFVLMMSVIGAPLGFGMLFQLWPLIAFVGYLVAGIWIGEWLLGRVQPGVVRERPYLAATTGVLLLQLVAVIPVLGLVAAIASLFGFGAVLLLGWRTLTSRPSMPTAIPGAAAPAAAG